MSEWLLTLVAVANAARNGAHPLLSLARWLDGYAASHGEPRRGARWLSGRSMPALSLWEALVASAGRESEWAQLSAEWHAELDARRARRAHVARGRVLSEAEVRETVALAAAAAGRELRCSPQAVRRARTRFLGEINDG